MPPSKSSPPNAMPSGTSPQMTILTTELAELSVEAPPIKSSQAQGWYIHTHYGILVWVELVVKTAGILTALITLTTVTSVVKVSGIRVVEEILLAPLVLGLLAPLIVSAREKELFSFCFAMVTLLAHLAVIAVEVFGDPGFSVALFCAFMIVGEIYRLVFLNTSERRPYDTTFRRRLIIFYIFFYINLYLAILVLETVTLIENNSAIG